MSRETSTHSSKLPEISRSEQEEIGLSVAMPMSQDDADILVMTICARGCVVRQGNR